MYLLNLPVDFRSRRFAFRGRSGEPPRRCAPVGFPLPRPPAGVFAPSTPINRVPKSTIGFNIANKILKPAQTIGPATLLPSNLNDTFLLQLNLTLFINNDFFTLG